MAELPGASYDVSKSRFSFGATPKREELRGGGVKWVGPQGALAIFPNGYVLATLNADVKVNETPWSASEEAMRTHEEEYFRSMGLQKCQTSAGGQLWFGTKTEGPTGPPRTTSEPSLFPLARRLDDIPVVGSLAVAKLNNEDQSTYEAFFWPTISSEIVAKARAFRDDLKDPSKLAAYKSKLPQDARGEGTVAIHHSGLKMTAEVTALITWDTLRGNVASSFDVDGVNVTILW